MGETHGIILWGFIIATIVEFGTGLGAATIAMFFTNAKRFVKKYKDTDTGKKFQIDFRASARWTMYMFGLACIFTAGGPAFQVFDSSTIGSFLVPGATTRVANTDPRDSQWFWSFVASMFFMMANCSYAGLSGPAMQLMVPTFGLCNFLLFVLWKTSSQLALLSVGIGAGCICVFAIGGVFFWRQMSAKSIAVIPPALMFLEFFIILGMSIIFGPAVAESGELVVMIGFQGVQICYCFLSVVTAAYLYAMRVPQNRSYKKEDWEALVAGGYKALEGE
jgi:MFS family permease